MTVRLAIAAALAAFATLAVAAPVQAAPTAALGQCTTTRGTIVAVDFGHWSGPIVRGCGVQANGQPDASGYLLLSDGGFASAGTRRNGPAFVCRIGSGAFAGGTQYPTPAQDACNVTPPASAYWSFWLALPGATSWHHSDGGATSDHPVSGEVELWTFGGTNTSGTSGSAVPAESLIDQLRARNTSPTGGAPVTTKAPVRATTSPAGGGAPGATTRGSTSPGAAATRSGSTSSSAAASGPGASASASPGTTSTSSTATDPANSAPGSGPAIVAAQPTATGHHSSGSVLPVVITAVILAAFGGLGGLSLLRRRRTDGD